MRGAGRAFVPTAVALACLVCSVPAQASEMVSLHDELMTIRAQPGDHRDRLRLDLDRSGKAVLVRGDLAAPFPSTCTALAGAGGLSCPIESILLLRVHTRGGDDRIELGTAGLPGDSRFSQQVLLAQVDAGTGNDVVGSAARYSNIKLRAGDDVASVEGAEFASISGGFGDDRITGGPGEDSISGGPGNDVLRTGAGGGAAYGNGGRDLIFGGGGEDDLLGGSGNDRISGMGGSDFLEGGSGADHLLGGGGADLISGGFGDDYLFGGPGPDFLDGGPGRGDRCTPGPGARRPIEGCELSF